MVEKTSKVELVHLAELPIWSRARRRLACKLLGHQRYGDSYVSNIAALCRRCGGYAR
jgi:hypothetical protein